MRTKGIAPKVKIPAWALGLIGAGVAVAGVLLGEESLKQVGIGLFLASPIGAAFGYSADPGELE